MAIEIKHGAEPRSRILTNVGSAQAASAAALQPFIGEAGRREFRREILGAEHERRLGLVGERSELRREEFVFKITAEQRAEEQKLNEAEIKLRTDPQYADIREEGIREIQKRRLGLGIAMPTRKDEKVPIKQQFEEQTFEDEYGNIYQLSPKTGEFKKIGTVESRRLSTKDELDLRKWAFNAAFNKETGRVDQDLMRSLIREAREAITGGAEEGIGAEGVPGRVPSEVGAFPDWPRIGKGGVAAEAEAVVAPEGGVRPDIGVPEEPERRERALDEPQKKREPIKVGGAWVGRERPEWEFEDIETGLRLYPEGEGPPRSPWFPEKPPISKEAAPTAISDIDTAIQQLIQSKGKTTQVPRSLFTREGIRALMERTILQPVFKPERKESRRAAEIQRRDIEKTFSDYEAAAPNSPEWARLYGVLRVLIIRMLDAKKAL